MNTNAFPSGEFAGYEPDRGMSLRDWFAGQALTGAMAMPINHGLNTIQPQSPMHASKAAEIAYRYADAMLAQRKKGGDA